MSCRGESIRCLQDELVSQLAVHHGLRPTASPCKIKLSMCSTYRKRRGVRLRMSWTSSTIKRTSTGNWTKVSLATQPCLIHRENPTSGKIWRLESPLNTARQGIDMLQTASSQRRQIFPSCKAKLSNTSCSRSQLTSLQALIRIVSAVLHSYRVQNFPKSLLKRLSTLYVSRGNCLFQIASLRAVRWPQIRLSRASMATVRKCISRSIWHHEMATWHRPLIPPYPARLINFCSSSKPRTSNRIRDTFKSIWAKH